MGTVQRATNTPATIPSEIRNGENPSVTSLVGASAAPSHAPAASPHATPTRCSERDAAFTVDCRWACIALPQSHEQTGPQQQDRNRNPEVRVGHDGSESRVSQNPFSVPGAPTAPQLCHTPELPPVTGKPCPSFLARWDRPEGPSVLYCTTIFAAGDVTSPIETVIGYVPAASPGGTTALIWYSP